MIRFLFGLLVGAIAGVAGTTYLFSTSGGDYLLLSSQRVSRLEEDLRRTVQEREQVVKKLDDAAALSEKMAAKFNDLEQRFQKLEAASQKPATEPPPEQTAPTTVEPQQVAPEAMPPPS